ncbi:hypothetical protein AB0E04_32040 [Streptomyces sp. NPDC048251]|uniref:hypothetical protein n=1 Tax=Streptomyces sp. NPDC048251 TaxID=3154501 RepID=UPI003418B396
MKDFAETEGEVSPGCKAGPSPENDGVGVGMPIQMGHTPHCPQYVIMQINGESGSRRVKEQDA